ncbi:MAG TPA: helix-turn-helix transcriptional regulator [Firmicutes bacterium]|nr:helix-turn-helix transcriptional regulator [Bacillota bacterium]
MGHPVRLCIVKNLAERGETNVSEMQSCLAMPQSTVSQHLARLRAAGVIKPKRRGTEVYYQLVSEKARQVVGIFFGGR